MIKPWHLPQLFSIAGFLWLPVWLAVRYLSKLERLALYGATAMIVATFYFATWNETRAWSEWSVLFAILASVQLERSFASPYPS
jgi:thiol:disulfide interchange protein